MQMYFRARTPRASSCSANYTASMEADIHVHNFAKQTKQIGLFRGWCHLHFAPNGRLQTKKLKKKRKIKETKPIGPWIGQSVRDIN